RRRGTLSHTRCFLPARAESFGGCVRWPQLPPPAKRGAVRRATSRAGAALPPIWPVEANIVFVRLPQALHERLQAAGAHYYVIHTDRSDPATVPPGYVLVRLVTSFSTTESTIDKFISLVKST